MDNLEIAKALFGTKPQQPNGGQTTTTYGIAVGDSENGLVRVNLGGDTVSADDEQTVEIETTFAVKEGDAVITSLIGADGTGKAPVVTGVVGRGDEQEAEIKSVTNYVWNDEHGLHVSTEERSVQGANILLDSDSLDIRNGASDSESDQTVYASFGREVTIGSRASGSDVGLYSQVFGQKCTAAGDYSFASGYQTMARGTYSHAEGYSNSIYTGDNSHAEGANNEIRASYAHAEGVANKVNGNASHAEGRLNTVGAYSHVEGEANTVSGWYCHVEGTHNLASSDNQHVQGKYNVDDANSTYADIAGNGSADNARSNAYNMDWNGNAEFKGEVYLGGCTPNGETPHPAVRYNTSNSQSEYYNGSSWAQVPSKRSAGWDELWTNEDETSNFAAQTVSLDLSGWAFIAIVTRFSTTHNYKTINIIRVGDTCPLDTGNLYSTMYTAKRSAAVSESGVTFSTGYRNTTGTTGTDYCIPVAIYGVVAYVPRVLKTASGSVITVYDALSKAVESLVVDINAVQNLNGYDNPWPAGGGKNKFDVSKMVNTSGITINNGVISVTGNAKNSGKKLSELADLTVGETYILTANTTGTENIIYLYGTGANVSWAFGTSKTITQEMLDALVMFYGGANTTSQISNFMIRLASVTDATYAPYSNICPISGWSNVNVYREAQYDAGATPYATINLNGTVYGGSLDVTTGVLTVTHHFATYNGSENWSSGTNYYVLFSQPNSTGNNDLTQIANWLKAGGSSHYTTYGCYRAQANGAICVGTIGSPWSSVSDFKTALATNPLTICYELATPQTVQLSPTTVRMVTGNNALWADSGDSEVQYWAAQ